jgi:hypothetical protein
MSRGLDCCPRIIAASMFLCKGKRFKFNDECVVYNVGISGFRVQGSWCGMYSPV